MTISHLLSRLSLVRLVLIAAGLMMVSPLLNIQSETRGSQVDQALSGVAGSGIRALAGVPASGIPLPGRIEAEDYADGGPDASYFDITPGNTGGAYRTDDVDIQPTADTSGTFDVGWIKAGEWLAYDVDIAAADDYTFTVRVATILDNRSLHIEVDGSNVTGSVTVPNTGGWQTWASVTSGPVSLDTGAHSVRFVFLTDGFNLNYVDVAPVAPVVPISLPGRIEAEDYSDYFDTTPGNTGGACRTDDVDIEFTSDTGGGCNVGWIAAGGWLEFPVDVAASGSYILKARVASPYSDKRFRIEVDGVDGTGSITVPRTGGWQTWAEVTSGPVTLDAGSHVVRLAFETNGFNLNYLDVAEVQAAVPIALPGRIEAEVYKPGGEDVGYHDSTSGNTGGACRSDDIDIQSTSDTGGGCNVGWIAAGEWLAYDVSVDATDEYIFTARVATTETGRRFHIRLDDIDVTGSVAIPQTGGWQSWASVSTGPVMLNAGSYELRILMDTSSFNLNYLEVTRGPATSSDPVLVGAGDIAGCSTTGDKATAALLDGIPGTVFTAGDNAYSSGTITEFTECYDPT